MRGRGEGGGMALCRMRRAELQELSSLGEFGGGGGG